MVNCIIKYNFLKSFGFVSEMNTVVAKQYVTIFCHDVIIKFIWQHFNSNCLLPFFIYDAIQIFVLFLHRLTLVLMFIMYICNLDLTNLHRDQLVIFVVSLVKWLLIYKSVLFNLYDYLSSQQPVRENIIVHFKFYITYNTKTKER